MADTDRVNKFLRLREALKDKVKDNQVMNLLCHCDWDDEEALRIFTEERGKAIAIMGEPDDKAINLADLGRDYSIEIDFEVDVRQFSCKDCDHMWWRRVRAKRPISTCFKCNKRFNALSRDKEYGWAKFNCSKCGREYHAFGAMDISSLRAGLYGKSESICHGENRQCGNLCEPTSVIRPLRGHYKTGKDEEYLSDQDDWGRGRGGYGYEKRRWKKKKDTHQCTASNCFQKIGVGPGCPLVEICVHPKSLPRRVIEASPEHFDTEIPVRPFLDQSVLASPWGDSPYNPPTFE
ncbi:SHFL-like protein [Mya arenaria]|uniref:SHFL-like protein n=1 Tax=Mya arenaria TaxID=6604 RepID=A0ABY7DUV0_MYAAR|nr:shiftless antiviral inhibitor of ribosomal frameshifting protein homolog [Mya arenaria]WAR00456.1 SHFL-like protein [Mya arenaria]